MAPEPPTVARAPELVADPAVVVLRWSADATEAIEIYAFLAMQVVAGCRECQRWVYSAQLRRPATFSDAGRCGLHGVSTLGLLSAAPEASHALGLARTSHAPKPRGRLVHVPTCRPPSASYAGSPLNFPRDR